MVKLISKSMYVHNITILVVSGAFVGGQGFFLAQWPFLLIVIALKAEGKVNGPLVFFVLTSTCLKMLSITTLFLSAIFSNLYLIMYILR